MLRDRGAKQGDPLGPVYCAAVLSIVMNRVRSRLENDGISIADVWYMDDGQLLCRPHEVDQVMRTIDEEAAHVGAERGRGEDAKTVCRLLGSEGAKSQVDPSWQSDYITSSCVPTPDNCLEGHVLGINFDDLNGFTEQFKSAVEDAKKARSSVFLIHHAPCEVAVIQSCLGACKITHLLRAAGLFIDPLALDLHDAQLKASVEHLLGGAVPEICFDSPRADRAPVVLV